MDSAFANAGQPHGALFDNVPKIGGHDVVESMQYNRTYHVRDAAILRAAYGPAAVPTVDPSDEDYTWTEKAAPLGVYIVPADDGAGAPFISKDELNELRMAELEEQVKGLQAQLADLGVLRELSVHFTAMRNGQQIDAELLARNVADIIRKRRADESSRA